MQNGWKNKKGESKNQVLVNTPIWTNVSTAKHYHTYWQRGLCVDQENTEQLEIVVQESHTISAAVACNTP